MTLVLSINGPDTIWLATDRRISYPGRVPNDNARKMLILDAVDGSALLGYAGLGATAGGTEPADWMGNVLRGRSVPIEHSLLALAEALVRQLPPHLASLPGPSVPMHAIVAPALVNDHARVYSIDMTLSPDRTRYFARAVRCVARNSMPNANRTPRMRVAGSGGQYLLRDRRWIRPLLKLAEACDRGAIGPGAVADGMASLNLRVSQNVGDQSVGPDCIVAWKHRTGEVYNGGGGHQFYRCGRREDDSAAIPTIVNGLDLQALINAIAPQMIASHEEMVRTGVAIEPDVQKINSALAALPNKPDETLK